MDRPGGSAPEAIEKVPPELLLVMMNASYACPTLAPGRTHTPLTRVPPFVAGRQTTVAAGRAVAGGRVARVGGAPRRVGALTGETQVPSVVGVLGKMVAAPPFD